MDVFPYNKFEIGRLSVIEDFSCVNNGVGDVIIGERSRVGLGNTIIGPVKIGDKVLIAQNVTFSGMNHNYQDVSLAIADQGFTTKEIIVDDDCWIGANSVVTAGVCIGKHSVVAAASVVTKDVPPYTIVAGNPAIPIKKYNQELETWERIK